MNDFSDEQIETFEEELSDLSEKDLQIHILVELMRIRSSLEIIATPQSESESESETELWECTRCGDEVLKDEWETHARKDHNAPPGMDVTEMFTVVE